MSDGGDPLSVANQVTDDQPVGAGGRPDEDPVALSDSAANFVATEHIASSLRDERLASGLRTLNEPTDELADPVINLTILRSGGPPPDGIPSIDAPGFHRASTVDYLGVADPLVALEINGDSRAYPLEILIWHELVNDTVGGVPVSVAYCPSASRSPPMNARSMARCSTLASRVCFTTPVCSCMTARPKRCGVTSPANRSAGRSLKRSWSVGLPRPSELEHGGMLTPGGLVLNRATGQSRRYGTNPYPGYDNVDADPFLFEGVVDGRYTAVTRVVGVASDNTTLAAAFPHLELREQGVVTSSLGGQDIVAFWVPEFVSALDESDVSGGVDIGATGVFSPFVGGQSLTFSSTTDADGGAATITDAEMGSTWSIFGAATDGELVGTQLDQLLRIDTFWFAWIAFHPDSAVAAAR